MRRYNRSPEVDQLGLIRVKRQTLFSKLLRQHVENSLRFPVPLEDDKRFIRQTDPGIEPPRPVFDYTRLRSIAYLFCRSGGTMLRTIDWSSDS